MANIEKAIEIEKTYVEARMRGEYPFHLVDKIRECGFEDLEEYFKTKKDHEFNSLQFEVIETTPLKAIADIFATAALKKNALLMAETPSTMVWLGDNSPYNETFCKNNNIPVLPIQTKGGTIVHTKGDLSIGICMTKKDGFNTKFMLDGLADIFSKYTSKKIEVNGNDILIDGYKVVGSSSYRLGDIYVFVALASMSEKSQLIKEICSKVSDKTPGYIDFMTTEQLREEIKTWLQGQ